MITPVRIQFVIEFYATFSFSDYLFESIILFGNYS